MFASILRAVFGWKGMLLGAGLAVAIGAAGGWYVRDKFCDATTATMRLQQANARIAALEDNLARIRRAQEADNQQAAEASAQLAQLKEQHRAILAEISDGECLTRDDVDRLRRGWNLGAPAVQSGGRPR